MTSLRLAMWQELLRAGATESHESVTHEVYIDKKGSRVKSKLEDKVGRSLIPVDVYQMISSIVNFEVMGDKDGWSHLPGDDGGATMWGIASNYATPEIAKRIEERTLTRDEAIHYLYTHYYKMIKEPHLYDRRILFILLDSKIHGGYATIRTLQQLLNQLLKTKLVTDGVLGHSTISVLRALKSEEVTALLAAFKKRIPSLAKQMADHELREQVRLGLPRQDFTAGFTNRLKFRISTAEQQV